MSEPGTRRLLMPRLYARIPFAIESLRCRRKLTRRGVVAIRAALRPDHRPVGGGTRWPRCWRAAPRPELVMLARGAVPAPAVPAASAPAAIAAWDDDGNGRVSCAEARAHGIAPVTRDHPAYPFMRDGDGDGVVCESGRRRASPARPAPSPRATGAGCGPYRNCTALRRDHPNGVPRGHCAYQRAHGPRQRWPGLRAVGPRPSPSDERSPRCGRS